MTKLGISFPIGSDLDIVAASQVFHTWITCVYPAVAVLMYVRTCNFLYMLF